MNNMKHVEAVIEQHIYGGPKIFDLKDHSVISITAEEKQEEGVFYRRSMRCTIYAPPPHHSGCIQMGERLRLVYNAGGVKQEYDAICTEREIMMTAGRTAQWELKFEEVV